MLPPIQFDIAVKHAIVITQKVKSIFATFGSAASAVFERLAGGSILPSPRRCQFHWVAVVLAVGIFVGTSEVSAQVIELEDLQSPFLDDAPFDLILLNASGDNAIIKTLPLGSNLPPRPLTGAGRIIFEFFEDGDGRLEVPFGSVSQVLTFNEILLEEANDWIEEGDYTQALRNLFYIYDHGGKNSQRLVRSLQRCLILDGKDNFANGEFELALSIYEDLYQQNPDARVEGVNRPLLSIIMACYDGILTRRFEDSKFIAVRQTLDSVIQKYGEGAKSLESKWRLQFKRRSDQLANDARRFATQGKGREAHLAAKQADQMQPGRPEILSLQEELIRKFPLIVVGVTQEGSGAAPNRIAHWGARRVGRLTQRQIVETSGLTDEGSKYEFPGGTLYRADEAGLKYAFEIKDEMARFGVPRTSAYQISARLAALADENSPSHNVAWQKIIDRIAIEGQNRVIVTLRTPYVRPEALMKVAYADAGADGQPEQDGPYTLTAQEPNFSTFEINPRYKPIPNQQHPAIVERLLPDASVAVEELINGTVDVVDRIPPADTARLKSAKGIEVRPYVLPTVHMLVPKIRGKLANDVKFRTGLSHAIDRQTLVDRVICGGQPVNGCEPISGPFPVGTEENDQIAYGYDTRIRSLTFNANLARVLIETAVAARPPQRPERIKIPTLVIAHTDSSSAINGAGAIARMWSQVGVETVTRQLQPGQSMPPDQDWDFLYLEATIEEPLSDAAKLIGPSGFAKNTSAPIEQSLQQLSYARSWRNACATLRRLHRQTSVDLAVVPLWQVKEHYAYRSTVRNIGRELIHLYQFVDRWNIDLTEEQSEK